MDPWTIDEADFPRDGSREEQLRFLIRYAILAPSSHNSEPWLFDVEGGRVTLRLDPDRWLRVADADQRELHVSAGCALENLLVAGEHFGFAGQVSYFPEGEEERLVARVDFAADEAGSSHRPPELFRAVTRRHTNHRPYDGEPVPEEDRTRLEGAAAEDGVRIRLTDDPEIRRTMDELVVRADALQFADPEWRAELGEWMGRGVFGTGWVLSKLSQLAVTHLNLARGTAKKDSELLGSASLLGVVTTDGTTRTLQVRAGQVFERMFLLATSMEMALQPMNQVLQLPVTKLEFAEVLPEAWGEPQLTFRLGYAEPEDHTPRRGLDDVVR